MAHSFKFSILQASPDRRRGERVNVGIVVFLKDRIDVRFPEIRKLKALTGHAWDEIAQAYSNQIASADTADLDAVEVLGGMAFVSDVFTPSDIGVMNLKSVSEYEDRLSSILNALIVKPSLSKGERQAKINSEISKMLDAHDILAKRGQTIDDHKVVKQFVVSKDKALVADFAYKNGALRVVSTLDLRGQSAAHGKACEKGATLHFARESFGDSTTTLAVYAVNPIERKSRAAEIEILQGFSAGNAYNWLNAKEQMKFRHLLY